MAETGKDGGKGATSQIDDSNILKTKVGTSKVEAKYRNLLKDPKVHADVDNLFENLKGCKTDDTVDSSTVLFLLNMLDISKNEPEYFWYVYSQLKGKERLTKAEFVELFLNPPDYEPEDIEDIKNLFQIFDIKGKGSFSKADFMELFRLGPMYNADPQIFEENIEKCFENLQKLYGNKEITPLEFFKIMSMAK